MRLKRHDLLFEAIVGTVFVLAVICPIFVFWLAHGLVSAPDKPLADLYKTGKIKFVPELILSDESFNGKGFFGQPSDIAVLAPASPGLAILYNRGTFACSFPVVSILPLDRQLRLTLF